MITANILQKAGAYLCALIGVWSILVVAHLAGEVSSWADVHVLILVPFAAYGLFAFVPFAAFIYPRLKEPQRSVYVRISLVEILIVGIFLWAIFFLRAAA